MYAGAVPVRCDETGQLLVRRVIGKSLLIPRGAKRSGKDLNLSGLRRPVLDHRSRRVTAFILTYPNNLPTVPKPSRANRAWSKRILVALRRTMDRRAVNPLSRFIPIPYQPCPNRPNRAERRL